MALTNAYCTLSDVKNALAIEDINDDLAIEAAIVSACRMIDDYTGRFFYKDGTSAAPVIRYYTPNDWWISYTTVWSATDYMVEPINNPRRGWPYTRILAVDRYLFPRLYPQTVRITGVWGWSAVPAEINLAARLQASRLFIRKQSPFGVAGSVDMGTVRLTSRLDPDVEALIRPLKKLSGVAY